MPPSPEVYCDNCCFSSSASGLQRQPAFQFSIPISASSKSGQGRALFLSPWTTCRKPAFRLLKHLVSSPTRRPRVQVSAVSTDKRTTPVQTPSNDDDEDTGRMFSNLVETPDGFLKRQQPSELACTALVAGTMIGAGVLALPTVAAPSGFIPSTATLLAVWAYMSVTGLLISEVTINTACALGRAEGISMLSLGRLTLGKLGGVVTATVYVLLHYAILTAYTAQGGQILDHAIPFLDQFLHTLSTIDHSIFAGLVNVLPGALFASLIGVPMLLFSAQSLARVNNTAVAAAVCAFFWVLMNNVSSLDAGSALQTHWNAVGIMVPVAFVSCVYHNVVSTVTMRLEGNKTKIRRAIIVGSGLPVFMFVLYDAVMLASSSSSIASNNASVAVAWFSALAIATSFIGFVEGLTELFADVRQTVGNGWQKTGRVPDFVATLVPPIGLAATSPDVFFKALDVAGTYGIAVLFGLLPAAMAWRNRTSEATKEFPKLVAGGNVMLAGIASVPVALIISRVWGMLHGHV